MWIVGLISEETLLHKVIVVKNRDHHTMQALFEKYCERDTVIYTDGYASYKAVDWMALRMTHRENIYTTVAGKKARTMRHQHLIEALWGNLKYHA